MPRKKKIGAIEEDIILIAGLGVAVWLIVKNLPDLLPDFLKGGNDAAKQQLQQTNALPPNNNPFSYQFQYGMYAQAPSAYGTAFWTNLHDLFFDPNNQGSGGTFVYAQDGETINNAFGALIETDGDIDNVFNSFATQADVSNVAAYLFFNYGVDLMALLKNGRGSIITAANGLFADHLASIITHVNSLPTH